MRLGEELRTEAGQAGVPPALRRLVFRRDGGRCVVPGCVHAVFVDLHHVVPRAEGGRHDPDTMTVMCGAHHSAVHRGQLIVEGRVSTGLVFRHADGSPYGRRVDARTASTHSLAFVALRKLGFRETETQRALQQVRVDAKFASPEQLVRAALAVLTRRACSS